MPRFLSIVLVLCLGAGFAAAATINASDLTTGSTTVNIGWATATADPRAFQGKTLAGYYGVGIKDGYVDGEIDLAGESIRIDFKSPTIISQITLGFLFQAGNYGDVVSEVASVQYSDTPNWAADYLSAQTATQANWSGPGTVTNLSPGVQPDAGVWRINNPFGNQAVSFLEFTPVQVGGPKAPTDNRNSDFAFMSLSGTTATPEPSTWSMLGLSLTGLAAAIRRRSSGW
jgi:hypothetical protein